MTVPAWVWAGAGALVGALVGGLVGGLVGAFVRGAGVLAGALVGAFAVVAGVGGAPTAALGVPSGSIDAAGYVEISAGDEAGTADEVPAVPDPPIAAGCFAGLPARLAKELIRQTASRTLQATPSAANTAICQELSRRLVE